MSLRDSCNSHHGLEGVLIMTLTSLVCVKCQMSPLVRSSKDYCDSIQYNYIEYNYHTFGLRKLLTMASS